jgi:DNA-binding MarR family transcriptional regulator
LSIKENVDFSNEASLIKLVASRYQILRPLYPDQEYSFTNLIEISGVDQGNLSRYLKSLNNQGLVKITKQKGQSMISLTIDVRRLIETIIELRGPSIEPHLQSGEKHLEEAIELLWLPDVMRLASDQIQILSKKTFVPPNSSYFNFIEEQILKERFDPVRSVLLISLKNILQNHNYEGRQIIGKKILPTIQTISTMFQGQRPSIIATEILDKYYLDYTSYETLNKEYIIRVLEGSDKNHNLRKLLTERFPRKKLELRSQLLQKYVTANPDERIRIESELTALY